MTNGNVGILIAIFAYLAVILYVGYRCARKNRTTDDFYLGGRKLGPLVTAMSAEASDMSSWLLMGLPGVAYLSGIADAAWTAIGLAIGTYLNFLLVARRIRRYTQETGAITIPDFFASRFGDKSNLLMSISALMIIVFFVPYTASGFAACGKLFSSLFGVDYTVAMLVSALVIVLYTTMGGFLAASTTDLIQSIIMTIALVVVVVFGTVNAGGMDAVMQSAKALPGYLSLTSTFNGASASPYSLLTIISTLAWGLGYFGMPHILLRFMAIKDEKKLGLSRRVASIWVIISMGIAILIGIVGYAMSASGSLETLTGSASENVIVKIAGLISQHGFLASLVAGVILAGILASTMSTADSQLLTAASGVSKNLMSDVLHLKMSEKTAMWAARITVLCVSLVAVFIAGDPNSSVFGIVSFAWAGFGAAFGPVVLFALFWRRANKAGALAAMVSGGAMVFIWKYLIRPLGGAWNLYELLPAFLVSSLMMVVFSLATAAPEKQVTDTFDKVNAQR